MFRLDLHELLFVYTALCLGVILVASVLHNLRRTRRESLALRNLLKCQLCAFEFRDAADSADSATPRCPACGAQVNRDPVARL